VLTAPERITIDVTVARDFVDPRRPRHGHVVALFELARRGEVELWTAPQGYRLDVRGDLAMQLGDMLTDENVAEAPQLSYPSEVTFPGKSLFPGNYVKGLSAAWDDVATTWRDAKQPPGVADHFHVETHIADGRDVFLTR
jgi:hypothetical protein